jgi:hypothetical protein
MAHTREMIMNRLTLNGFSKWEAKKIAFAKTNQYDNSLQDPEIMWQSGLIQKAIKSRMAYIQNCRKLGWDDATIRRSIKTFYKGQENAGDSAIFRFLKIEYMIPSASVSNYALSVLLRARGQINRVARVMGVRYGKSLPKTYKPKPELFVKQPQDNFLGKI